MTLDELMDKVNSVTDSFIGVLEKGIPAVVFFTRESE